MLDRREFIKISAMLAAGATLSLAGVEKVLAVESVSPEPHIDRPLYRFHGHAKSGCAFRPEITDVWAGGGAVVPEEF